MRRIPVALSAAPFVLIAIAYLVPLVALASPRVKPSRVLISFPKLYPRGRVVVLDNADGTVGLAVVGAGRAVVRQPRPAAIEVDLGYVPQPDNTHSPLPEESSGYSHVVPVRAGMLGSVTMRVAPGVTIGFLDRWTVEGGVLRLFRQLRVHGNAPGGFDSAVTFDVVSPVTRNHVDYLAPGLLYGGTTHLPKGAIGGPQIYGPGHAGIVMIREDRLPAPLFGTHFSDGSSVAILDTAPDGATTKADADSGGDDTIVDRRLRFGALGAEQPADHLRVGFWFPGSEGEETLGGGTAASGLASTPAGPGCPHCWRRREHPFKNGLTQHYSLAFRFGAHEGYVGFLANTWRWAYGLLAPKIEPVNLGVVRGSVAAMLAARIITTPFGTGIPTNWDATTGQEIINNNQVALRPAMMGFIGKDIENAELLIQDSVQHPNQASARESALGEALIGSFERLQMSPPQAAGFDLSTGSPTSVYPHEHEVYLRQLTDDFKALARGILFERAHGRQQPGWVTWATQFGDWLLTQQASNGSFPRAWANGTGVVADHSTSATDEPVPFLLDMTAITGDGRYRAAALRAGRYAVGQQVNGQYWGAAIDQGNIVDKESASMALESDMALWEATHDPLWLAQARQAADVEATWTWIWNLPMAVDAANRTLGWKHGVPTYGLSNVASNGSLADEYEEQDVPELTELFKATNDPGYFALARLLLHDEQAMLALPGRTYDLAGPGWQQEFWKMANGRGTGYVGAGTRDWVPWIAAVKLRALLVTEQQNPRLFARLAR
jgi:hypothetical protein